MADPFAAIYGSAPAAVKTQASSTDPFASIYGASKTTPSIPANPQTHDFNGQQIPITVPTKNLVSYDSSTGNKTFKIPDALGGGVYTEDTNNNIVKGGHTTYGGVVAKPGMQRDDIIPAGLGGANSQPGNIKMVPLDTAHQQDTIETQLSKDVKTGKTQPKAAITSALSQKDDIANNPGFWGNVGNIIGDVGRGLKTGADMVTGKTQNADFVQNPVTATINMYKQPSDMVKQAEAGVPNVPVLHQAAQGILRTIIPLAEGFGTLVGGDIFGQNELSNQVANDKTKQTVGKQAQPNTSTEQVTHKLTAEDVVNVALNSIQVGLLLAPFLKEGATKGALKLSDAIAKESKVPITYQDMQKITTSGSDAEAISRVGQEKFNAFQDATKTDSVKQALKDGYVTLADKQPTTFSNIIRNAATRPIGEIGSFGKTYGADINVPNTPLLTEKITPAEAQALPEETLKKYIPVIENGEHSYILKQLPEPPKLDSLPSPKTAGLLEAPKIPYKNGEGFTMTDKANPEMVKLGKALNEYRSTVHSYNQKPTPTKLKKALAAKTEYENLRHPPESAPFAHEVNTPKPTEVTPFTHEAVSKPFASEIKPTVVPKTGLETTIKAKPAISTEKPITAPAPKPTVVYRAQEKGTTGEFYTTDKSNAEKYGALNKNPELIQKDISNLNLKQVSSKEMLNEKENPETRKNFDGLAFKHPVTGSNDVVLFNKETPKVESTTEPGKTPSKIAQSIEQKAVEANLTKGFEGVAGYDKITIKDQAERASKLMSDPEQAMRVIRGEDPLPEGLRGTALVVAAEEHIKATGNARMAYELANSPLVSETSAAAQELRLAAEREPDSLTRKLQEVKQAREQAAIKKNGNMKKAKATVKADIKNEIAKAAPKVKDWAGFLQELKCN